MLDRYTQSEPIGFSGGLNTYGYVEGNSLIESDYFGLANGGIALTKAPLSNGVNYFSYLERHRTFSSRVSVAPNSILVLGHGSPLGIVDNNSLKAYLTLGMHSNYLTPQQLANDIQNHPRYKKGMSVWVLGCNTAQGFDSAGNPLSSIVLQELSNILGDPVYGTTRSISFNYNGSYTIEGDPIYINGRATQHLKNRQESGGYRVYFPQKKIN